MCKWCWKGDLVVKRASLSSRVPFQAHWAAVPALLPYVFPLFWERCLPISVFVFPQGMLYFFAQ